MALDKAIQHGKEKRKPYRKAKAISHTCRNHGSCPYCRDNRLVGNRRLAERIIALLAERGEALTD